MTHAVELMGNEEMAGLPETVDAGFGSLATARGHLPLEAMDVRAHVVGLGVKTELRQSFVNTVGEPVEATYIFPLPDRWAVNGFRLRIGERVIVGVIDERGQARQMYDDAIRAGHRAAIAEEERPDVFTVRVGNIMPGQRAAVELDLVGALALDRGEATFRFPLVVAPRYVPGTPLEGGSVGDGVASDTDATPDASRISPPVLLPGFKSPVRLSIAVEIDPAGIPVSRMRASLHSVLESSRGGRQIIEVRPGERLDRDFILRWALGDGALRTSLVVEPDATGGSATFALTLLPPEATGPARPRDVVLVLDRSGSMEGWKMVAARRAAARVVDMLSGDDRFAVIAFDDHIDTPKGLVDGLSPASDRSRFRAVEFLARVDSRGGTEMAPALRLAASHIDGGYRDRERILILVTDGQVGNEDQILRDLAPRLRGARIFPIGIDRAVNAGFLGRLADLGGGAAELVESEDRLDEVMDRIQRRIATPVVTELSLEEDGVELEAHSVAPRRLPDLLAGVPVVLRGRLRRVGPNGAIVVRGADAGGRAWSERVPFHPAPGGGVAALWARALIRDLEDRYAAGDEHRDAIARRIVDVSRRYSVLSRFTAFLAVDRSEKVNPGGELHRQVQPVEAPAGWDMLAPPSPPAAHGRVMAVGRAMTPSMPASAPPPAPAPMTAMPVMASARMPMDYDADDKMDSAAAPSRRPAPSRSPRMPAAGPRMPARSAPAKDTPLARRVRELAERMRAGRGAVDGAALALAILAELDTLAPQLGARFATRVDRLRRVLRAASSGVPTGDALRQLLDHAQADLDELAREVEEAAPTSRSGAFWK